MTKNILTANCRGCKYKGIYMCVNRAVCLKQYAYEEGKLRNSITASKIYKGFSAKGELQNER